MNNKGFATTTIVYTSIILLSLLMFSILKIEYSKYNNQNNFINNIKEELSECLKEGGC